MTEEEMRNQRYRVAAIDCDILSYQAAAAIQKRYYQWCCNGEPVSDIFDSAKAAKEHKEDVENFFGESTEGWERNTWLTIGDPEDAIKVADNYVKQIKFAVDAGRYNFWIDGEGNHRVDKANLVEYKSSRKGLDKPVHLQAVRDHFIQHYGANLSTNLETDDVISVIQAKGYYYNPETPLTCSVSPDKDARGTPGVIYDRAKDEFCYITEHDANLWLFCQILWGDAIDSIPGLPELTSELREKYGVGKRRGLGQKTAEAILDGSEDIQEMYQRTLEAYQAFYGDAHEFTDWRGNTLVCSAEEMLDEQAELVFMMRRKDEYWADFKKREILNE